jgi:hypothetical protein
MISRRALKTKKAQIDSKICGRKGVVEEIVESGLGKRGRDLGLVGMWRTFYFHIHSVKQRLLVCSRATFNGTFLILSAHWDVTVN